MNVDAQAYTVVVRVSGIRNRIFIKPYSVLIRKASKTKARPLGNSCFPAENLLKNDGHIPSLNTQSCIKGLWWYWITVFGPFGQPGQASTEKKGCEQLLRVVFSCFQDQFFF